MVDADPIFTHPFNFTTSSYDNNNDNIKMIRLGWGWKQSSLGWPSLVFLAPLSALGLVGGSMTLVGLCREQVLRRRKLTPYLTSITLCDMITASVLMPLAIAKSYSDDSDALGWGSKLGDAWYCIDALIRSLILIHLISAAIEFCLSVSKATSHRVAYNLHRSTSVSGGGRAQRPKMLTRWFLGVMLSVSPFLWYMTGDKRDGRGESNLRKLVVCVFILTFLIPVITMMIVGGLMIRAYLKIKIFSHTKTDLDPTSKFLLKKGSIRNFRNSSLRRSVSGISRRGSHRRSGGSSIRHRRSARSTGRASPQLDRHPSVRYSIRRRSQEEQVERNNTSTQGLIDKEFDKELTIRDGNGFGQARLSADLAEQLDGFKHSGTLLQAEAKESGSRKSSDRSSKSDKFLESPKLDRHPSLRFGTRRKPDGSTTSGRRSPSRVDAEPLLHTEASGPDPYSLLSSLQRAHRRLVSQTSSPDACSWNEPAFFPSEATLRPSSSMRHKAKSRDEVFGMSLSRKSSQRRSTSLLARRSSSKRRPQSVVMHESPKLDRHPSLRYSTKRQSHPPGGAGRRDKGTAASSLSIAYHPYSSGTGDERSETRSRDVCLSIGRRSELAPSPGGSVLSIGTCHDLMLPSTSNSSVKDKHAQLTAACTAVVATVSGQQTAEQLLNHVQASPSDAASLVNRLHVNSSEKNLLSQDNISGAICLGQNSESHIGPADSRFGLMNAHGDLPVEYRLHRFGGGSQRASCRRSFQRDTTHKVEDWLSLESKASKFKGPNRLSVRNNTSPERPKPANSHSTSPVYVKGASVESLKKKNPSNCSAGSLQHIISGEPLNWTDHRLIRLFLIHRSEFLILITFASTAILCYTPWLVINLLTQFCRTCWFSRTWDNVTHRKVDNQEAVIMFIALQSICYLSVIVRPFLYHLFVKLFHREFRKHG